MTLGTRRTILARTSAVVGCVFGLIGFVTGLVGDTWRLPPLGWMIAGILVLVLALFLLVDGMIAYGKVRFAPRSLDD